MFSVEEKLTSVWIFNVSEVKDFSETLIEQLPSTQALESTKDLHQAKGTSFLMLP